MNQPSYFRSSGYLSDGEIFGSTGATFSLEALPAFLRTLLVTDGTVTKALEAYFWEPVEVVAVNQQTLPSAAGLHEILDDADGEVLSREVSLAGKQSGVCYARARSQLVLSRLPTPLVEGLIAGELGIGELLREEDVETYREIIHLDYFPTHYAGALAPAGLDEPQVSRSYRIRVGGQPAILVTEFFPLGPYRK
ncbi:MAG: chorismate--pyruvate lyase family protein [Thiotrichales bacterium]